jgi:hypothetical protein
VHWREKLVILLGEGLRAMRVNADPRRVVDNALAAAGPTMGSAVERDPERLAGFVRGPLAGVLTDALGVETTQQVVAFLELVTDWQDTSGLGESTWPPAERGGEVSTLPAPRAPLLLIAGLDRRARSLLGGALTEAGYAVLVALDNAEAKARCRVERPDLVLWDDSLGSPPTRQRILFVQRPLHLASMLDTVKRLLATEGPALGELRQPEVSVRSISLARWLDDGLASVAAASVAKRLVTRALQRASLTTVPSAIDRFTAFLTGQLYEVVRDELGEDAADTVISTMHPVVTEVALTSEVRPRADLFPAAPKAGEDKS